VLERKVKCMWETSDVEKKGHAGVCPVEAPKVGKRKGVRKRMAEWCLG
jgi:hypothetical protein